MVPAVRAGRSLRVGLNLHEGKLIANVSILPTGTASPHFQDFLINTLLAVSEFEGSCVMYDHGHKFSNGCSKASICILPRASGLILQVLNPTVRVRAWVLRSGGKDKRNHK